MSQVNLQMYASYIYSDKAYKLSTYCICYKAKRKCLLGFVFTNFLVFSHEKHKVFSKCEIEMI